MISDAEIATYLIVTAEELASLHLHRLLAKSINVICGQYCKVLLLQYYLQ